jgi:hypothetical protein
MNTAIEIKFQAVRDRASRAVEQRNTVALNSAVSVLWGVLVGAAPEDGNVLEYTLRHADSSQKHDLYSLIRELGLIEDLFKARVVQRQFDEAQQRDRRAPVSRLGVFVDTFL